jgi:AraC-like DNA-binding protein
MEQRWSTVDVPDGRKFVHWREVVCQAFTQLSPERVGTDPFEGEIRLRRLGAGSVSSIRSRAQIVRRGPREIATVPSDSVFLNIQAAGRSLIAQGRDSAGLAPGTFALVDATRPFEMRFDGAFRHVSIHLPRAALVARLGAPDRFAGRCLAPPAGVGAVLLAYLAAVLDAGQGIDEPRGQALLLNLADLIALSLGEADARRLGTAARHLDVIRHYVAGRLDDPALSPETVARHFRLSTRQVHKLFAAGGESFGRWTQARRLERAHAALADPAFARRGIAEIAFACGFADPGHFARAFKSRYGMTPSDRRRAPFAAARKDS